MALYMYQAAYTSQSWAAQMSNPQNRVEAVGRQVCEAVGGKLIGGWLCFGDYDIVIIADVPNNESMAAVALGVGAGGAIKASKTTVLMTGEVGVEALKKADAVAKAYRPAQESIAPQVLCGQAKTLRKPVRLWSSDPTCLGDSQVVPASGFVRTSCPEP